MPGFLETALGGYDMQGDQYYYGYEERVPLFSCNTSPACYDQGYQRDCRGCSPTKFHQNRLTLADLHHFAHQHGCPDCSVLFEGIMVGLAKCENCNGRDHRPALYFISESHLSKCVREGDSWFALPSQYLEVSVAGHQFEFYMTKGKTVPKLMSCEDSH